MTPKQIELVQQSFGKVAEIQETAADLFYGRLFEIDPTTKPLFNDDLAPQKKKLMQMLATCVSQLKNLDQLAPMVKNLGNRHNTYGVQSEHYKSVGEALLWTLEQGLGEDFTPEVREAWGACYSLLSSTMES